MCGIVEPVVTTREQNNAGSQIKHFDSKCSSN